MNPVARPLLRGVALAGLLACSVASWAQNTSGQGIFDTRCVACHGAGGAGIAGLAPALAGALPYLGQPAGRSYVLQVLTHGLSGKIVSQGQTFIGAMPAQTDLSDADLAAVATYVASLNGQPTASITAEDAAAARATKVDHKALREQRAALLKP